MKLILRCCRRRKGASGLFLTQYANGRSLAELMFIHPNGINLQTLSKLQREELTRFLFHLSNTSYQIGIYDGECVTVIPGDD